MNKELSKEIRNFLIVGGLATICDYLVFYLFNLVIFKNINHNLNIGISTALGFLTGLFINWFLQKKVYANAVLNKKNFLKFSVISLIGLLITELGMLLGSPLYNKFFITQFKIDFYKIFFKILMTAIVLVINFIVRKFFVFGKEKEGICDVDEKNM